VITWWNVPVDESVIILRVGLFGFVKGKPFEHADVGVSRKAGVPVNRKVQEFSERFARLALYASDRSNRSPRYFSFASDSAVSAACSSPGKIME